MCQRVVRSRRAQAGQSATEFLVILPALILLVFGIIQFALMYQTRATLNHATLLAARAGAMHNGDMAQMRAALARGLTPLFASEATAAGYANAWLRAQQEASPGYAAIDVLNPTAAAFNDFERPRLDGNGGGELPNDTLNYRNTSTGGGSNISIQDANLLHVRINYCMRLIVPIIDRILYQTLHNPNPATAVGMQATGMSNPMATAADPNATVCGTPGNDGRRILVQSEAFVRMQSSFFRDNLVAGTGGTPGGGIPGGGFGGIRPGGSGGSGSVGGGIAGNYPTPGNGNPPTTPPVCP
jgi:uncharacterized membrane protein YgcG